MEWERDQGCTHTLSGLWVQGKKPETGGSRCGQSGPGTQDALTAAKPLGSQHSLPEAGGQPGPGRVAHTSWPPRSRRDGVPTMCIALLLLSQAAQPGPWKAPAPRATINNTSYLQVPMHRLRDGVRVQGCLPGVQAHSREALRLSDHVGDGTAKSMCRKCVSITFQDAESKAAVSQVRSGWCGAGPGPAG